MSVEGATVGCCSSGLAIDTAGSGAHVQLVLGDVLQPLQTAQLVVEREHHAPGHHTHRAEDQPGEECEDVVAKDEIIDNGAVEEVDQSPEAEGCHGAEPRHKPGLVFISECIDQEAGGDKESDGSGDAEEAGHDEQVPDVVVANVDKLVGDPVISGVDGAWCGLLQTVDIKHRLFKRTRQNEILG